MKKRFLLVTAGALFINWSISAGQDISDSASGKSEWVYTNQSGKLAYKLTKQGDRIMDFSHAGYKGGGVAIPEVSVKATLSPSGKDDTGNIQAAIDKVSAMPLNGEFRGAVLLSAGKYSISSPIVISTTGVILKGSGSGIDGGQESIIMMSGKPFNAVTIRKDRNSSGPVSTGTEKITTITDSYVPSGAVEFSVVDASGFRKGDVVSIEKKVTSAWIEHMQMHNLVRDGKPQTWIKAGSTLATSRRIARISGNKIILDVPLSDSYSKTFGDVEVKTVQPGGLKNCGIEHLHIVSPSQPVSHSEPHFTALRLNGEDCWAKDLFIEETMNSVGVSGMRITVQNVTVLRKALHVGSSRPAEFAPNGTQVLIDRCKVIADNVWFMATGSGIAGPIVILNCEFIGDQRAESHQRWSTGMLYDNVKALNGGIDFRNRGSMGSGHGWSMGWGVAWNCEAKDFIIQTPPGACNWMIGCIGESKLMPRPFDKEPMLPGGIRDSPGVHVAPKSLYLAQLKERLGEQGLRNIGYDSGTEIEAWVTNPDRSMLFRKSTEKILFSDKGQGRGNPIVIDESHIMQSIDGFGFALTGGSAELMMKMSPEARKKLILDLFSSKDNHIGVSYIRLTIGASDLNSFVYSYDDLKEGEADFELKRFDLGQDKKDVIPVMKEILEIAPDIRIMASPWSPPVWMKTNGKVKAGSLKKECYEVYAQYFVRYIQEMKKEGIAIDAITVQNEPLNANNTPSMRMSAAEQGEFIKNHLGPAFGKNGLQTKIILFDHNLDRPDYPLTILNDPAAARYADGSGFHHYGGTMEAMTILHNAYPDKNLYFTEQMVVERPGSATIDIASQVKRLIIGATRNWSRNVILWNFAADPLNDPHTNDGGCSMCQGAVTLNGDSVKKNLAYFVMAHASKFVTPGSVRIASTRIGDMAVNLTNDEEQREVVRVAVTQNIEVLPNVAFYTPEGKIVLIVANDSGNTSSFQIRFRSHSATIRLTPGSVGTYVWQV